MDAIVMIAIATFCGNYDRWICQKELIKCVNEKVKPLDSRDYQNKVLLECVLKKLK